MKNCEGSRHILCTCDEYNTRKRITSNDFNSYEREETFFCSSCRPQICARSIPAHKESNRPANMCESIISRCHWNTISLVVAAQNFYDLAFFFPFFRLNEPILFGGRRNRGDHTRTQQKLSNSFGWELFAIDSHTKKNEWTKKTQRNHRWFFFLLFFSLSRMEFVYVKHAILVRFFLNTFEACMNIAQTVLDVWPQNRISIIHTYQWNASLWIYNKRRLVWTG